MDLIFKDFEQHIYVKLMVRIFHTDNIMEETIHILFLIFPKQKSPRPHLPTLAPLTYYGDNNKIPPFLSSFKRQHSPSSVDFKIRVVCYKFRLKMSFM